LKQLLIIATAIFISCSAFSQTATTTEETPIYLRFPTIPEFTVYKAPDSTVFTRNDLHKKKNTIFVIFSPDCEHCQRETEMLTQNINKFKNTQFVMVTYLPWEEMIAFYKHYKIANYPQITMARDTKFFFPVFFKVRNLPSIFVYDKKGNLKKSFEGDVKPETILAEL
jgi:thiol-disulfide isomerase/thioredoxin